MSVDFLNIVEKEGINIVFLSSFMLEIFQSVCFVGVKKFKVEK